MKHILKEQRTCRLCNIEHIENEEHFLIQCSEYNDIRSNLFGPININDATDEFKRIIQHSDQTLLSQRMNEGMLNLQTLNNRQCA